MKNTRSLLIPVVLNLLTAFLLTGCAARAMIHPIHSYVVPDYAEKGIGMIGLTPIVDHTGSQDGPGRVLPLLEERASQEIDYVFLSEEEVLGRAQKKGIRDKYSELLSSWRKEGTIDTEEAASVGKEIGVDALVFTEISRWSKEWISPNMEGTSRSQVGIRLVLVDGKTGEKLWEASDEQAMESAYYSPESGIGTHVDEAGMVRASSLGGVPDPPPIEDVAVRVLDAIFKVFP